MAAESSHTSHTYPEQANQIRKGDHIMIKGNPCKVIDVSTFKNGKHGHAKCHFVGKDLFSDKKMEDVVEAKHNCDVPVLTKADFQVVNVEDGRVSLFDRRTCCMRAGLPLPSNDEKLAARMVELWAEEKDYTCVVLKAACVDREMIVGELKMIKD